MAASNGAASNDSRAARAVETPLTSRDVLALAIPVMLSNATTPLVGLVDTAVIGQLGQAHLMGGVAVAATIFNVLYWGFGFLRLGTTGFTAQAVGAGITSEIAANLFRPLLIALVLGTAIIVARGPITSGAVWLMGGSSAVQATAQSYIDVRVWSAPAVLINITLMGWLVGLGRTSFVFLLQVLLNTLNIGLALLFVAGLGWGVPGAGGAAAIADWTAALAGLGYALSVLRSRGWWAPMATVLDAHHLKTSFAVNRDITIRTLCVVGVFSFFVAQAATAGDLTLAANAALHQLAMVTVYLLDGFEIAAQTLVGQAVGSRELGRYRASVRLTFLWSAAVGVLMSLILWVAGPRLIAMMSSNADVQATARLYLGWAAQVPVVGVWCFIYDGFFIGATRGPDLRNMMLISTAAYVVAWAGLTAVAGNHGLWAALLVFFTVRAVTLWARMPALQRDLFGPVTPALAGATPA